MMWVRVSDWVSKKWESEGKVKSVLTTDMCGELPGQVDWVLYVEGQGWTGPDTRVVEQGRADLAHHLLQQQQQQYHGPDTGVVEQGRADLAHHLLQQQHQQYHGPRRVFWCVAI